MAPSKFLLVSLCSLAWTIPTTSAEDPVVISVPFSSNVYGPDGPWYGVKVRVGGDMNVQTATTNVDLLPGGEFTTYIPSQKSCTDFTDQGDCGLGGMWSPDARASGFAVDWEPSIKDKDFGFEGKGTMYGQAMTFGDSQPYTLSNISITSLDEASIKDARSEEEYGLPLGFLSLGSEEQSQVVTKIRNRPVLAWNSVGLLYNTSTIASYSYSLHSGSASWGYPGSLTFGGYNSKRMVGPYMSWGKNNKPFLKDISIGIEYGGSPFANDTKLSNLLPSNPGLPDGVPISFSPTVPYLVLPEKACSAIASSLPVTFDKETQFYLWKTDDPLYETIINSPAYLGFTFAPPANGSVYPAASNVTIKIPFSVLNLTLTYPLADKPTPYFPCRNYADGISSDYQLGRTFLQAVVLTKNWATKTTYLAQAVGPGTNFDGGGQNLTILHDEVMVLDIPNNGSIFSVSWADQWIALPGSHSTNNPDAIKPRGNGNANGKVNIQQFFASSDTTLSKGAKIGISVGVTLGTIAIVGAIFFFIRRHKHADRRGSYTDVPLVDSKQPAHADIAAIPHPSSPPPHYDPHAITTPGHMSMTLSPPAPYDPHMSGVSGISGISSLSRDSYELSIDGDSHELPAQTEPSGVTTSTTTAPTAATNSNSADLHFSPLNRP